MRVGIAGRLLGLTTALVLVACAPAFAGTAYGGYGFSYSDDAGQPNRLSVSVSTSNTGTTLTFSDPTGIVVGDTNCRYVSEPNLVACSGDPEQGVTVNLGFGSDTVRFRGARISATVNGGSGNDGIYGGSGSDRLNGGSGNDRIFGGFGNDVIFGGVGIDSMYGGPGRDRIDGLIRDFARR